MGLPPPRMVRVCVEEEVTLRVGLVVTLAELEAQEEEEALVVPTWPPPPRPGVAVAQAEGVEVTVAVVVPGAVPEMEVLCV